MTVNIEIIAYEQGLQEKTALLKDPAPERVKVLVTHTAMMLAHFFKTEVYGDPSLSNPDSLPLYWPYVRYLVYDALRPRFGSGDPEFIHHRFGYKFQDDCVAEATQIAQMLPEDLTNFEWRFMAEVSAYMLLESPFLKDLGLVSPAGSEGFMMQSLRTMGARMEGKDFYWECWEHWKEESTAPHKE